jgi:hypothetical protein
MTACLRFDSQAEEVARYYIGIFKQAKLGRISHYGTAGYEIHHKPTGSVLPVQVECHSWVTPPYGHCLEYAFPGVSNASQNQLCAGLSPPRDRW